MSALPPGGIGSFGHPRVVHPQPGIALVMVTGWSVVFTSVTEPVLATSAVISPRSSGSGSNLIGLSASPTGLGRFSSALVIGGATPSPPVCLLIGSFPVSATDRFAVAAGLLLVIAGVATGSFEALGSVSSEPPQPERHNGTASKQVPRRLKFNVIAI